MKKLLTSLLLASPLFALESRPTEFDKFFQKGDTVAFLGDSITHGSDYHALVQTFFSTRYPELDLWTENVGRSGDTSWGTLKDRLDGDLYPFEPDSVILHFGMNDVGRDTFKGMKNPPTDESRKGRRGQYRGAMNKLVDTLLKKDLQVAIMSPTLYDDGLKKEDSQHQSPHLNAELAKFGEIGLALATEKNLPFIDVHTPLTRITEEKQAKDETFSFTPDRVHPMKGGYPIMAYELLKAFGADPIVYDLEIKADGTVVKTEQTRIADFDLTDGTFVWTAVENHLPFPVQEKGNDKAFSLVSFQEELNRMLLKVTDLPEEKYLLNIDDREIGTFSATDLAAGINLATKRNTPQYVEAAQLRNNLIGEKLELQAILRDLNSYRLNLLNDAKIYPELLEVDWNNPDSEAVIAIREKQIAAMKEKGRNTGSYFGHITNQGKRHLSETAVMRARLAEIRTLLADLPESRTYKYSLSPAK